MAKSRKCKGCGNEDNINFAINIGLCDSCIGERLEELEAIILSAPGSDEKDFVKKHRIWWDLHFRELRSPGCNIPRPSFGQLQAENEKFKAEKIKAKGDWMATAIMLGQAEEVNQQLRTENEEKQALIDALCSQEPCPKCGYGVTGACYGCEIKKLHAENKRLRQSASEDCFTKSGGIICMEIEDESKRLKNGHVAIMKEINDNPALHNDAAISKLHTISEQSMKGATKDGKEVQQPG